METLVGFRAGFKDSSRQPRTQLGETQKEHHYCSRLLEISSTNSWDHSEEAYKNSKGKRKRLSLLIPKDFSVKSRKGNRMVLVPPRWKAADKHFDLKKFREVLRNSGLNLILSSFLRDVKLGTVKNFHNYWTHKRLPYSSVIVLPWLSLPLLLSRHTTLTGNLGTVLFGESQKRTWKRLRGSFPFPPPTLPLFFFFFYLFFL